MTIAQLCLRHSPRVRLPLTLHRVECSKCDQMVQQAQVGLAIAVLILGICMAYNFWQYGFVW